VFGHLLLGEHLTLLKVGGFLLATVGVWLATRASTPVPSTG
jgi:drug/metabolite transporter (DMT)-like permease